MDILKSDDPTILDALKPEPGRLVYRDDGAHAQGVTARKAKSASEIQGLSPAGEGKPSFSAGFNLSQPQLLEQACQYVLDFVATQAPEWAERIRVGCSERDYTASQFTLSVFGHVLDRSLHLELTPHPYLDVGPGAIVETKCGECGKAFKPSVPGQPVCSQECGAVRWKRHEAEEAAKTAAEADARRKARMRVLA